MTSVNFNTAVYLETGGVTAMSVTTLQNPGDLGRRFALKNHSLTVGAGAIVAQGAFKIFQVVKRSATDGVTSTIGSPAYWMARTTAGNDFTVTADMSDGGGLGQVAGVFLGALPADGKFGIIQVGGLGPVALKGSPTVAASTTGLPIIGTTTDLEADTVSTVTAAILGFCLSAKNATLGGGAIGTDVVMAHLCPPVNE